jgi:hypothetical protein
MNDFKATPEQWIDVEFCDKDDFNSACVLELRARVEALEAQAGNLKGSLTSSTPPTVATDESAARAAILEVVKWLRSELVSRDVAERLEQEAGR